MVVITTELMFSGCEKTPVETEGGEIEAYVFFATDAHYAVNTPAFTEVMVDNKLVGVLTDYIVPESVLLDSVRQCNPDSLYSYVVIYKIDQPKNMKYQLITKGELNKAVIHTTVGELSVDKLGSYNVFHTYNGRGG